MKSLCREKAFVSSSIAAIQQVKSKRSKLWSAVSNRLNPLEELPDNTRQNGARSQDAVGRVDEFGEDIEGPTPSQHYTAIGSAR